MVVKYGSEPWDVFYIEATSNNGVSFIRWSGIRHAIGSFYDKVVLRHLDWERTDESLDLLEKYFLFTFFIVCWNSSLFTTLTKLSILTSSFQLKNQNL